MSETKTRQVVQVRVANLQPADDNPRRDVGDLDSLAASIVSIGILQPLVVVPEPGQAGRWRIVAGHRRHAAAVQAGIDTVPCIVREDLDDQGRREAMLVENLQRRDLDPLEEARGYQLLATSHRMSQRAIADAVGVTQPHVSKRLKLLELPELAHELLGDGRLTIEDAVELAKCDNPGKLLAGADLTVRRGHYMSVSYLIEQERTKKAAKAKLDKRRRELEDAGIPVVDGPAVYASHLEADDTRTVRLEGLHRFRKVVTDEHSAEPCHAVILEHGWEYEVCTDPSRHPVTDTGQGQGQLRLEQQKAVKAREAASKLRGEIAERIFTGLTTGEGDASWVLDHLLTVLLDQVDVYQELPAVGRLLGETWAAKWNSTALMDYAAAGREELLTAAIATVLVLGDYGPFPPARLSAARRAHLELLIAHGYEPNEFEQQLLAGQDDADTADAA